MSWNCSVPPRKAANIRKAIGALSVVPSDIPVKYATNGRRIIIRQHARDLAVPGDDAKCAAANELADQGTPGIVRRREAAALETTKHGQPVIMLYAKNCQQTDKYDATSDISELHQISLLAWPRSWRPHYRMKLAQRRRNEIKNGAKVKRRKTPRGVQQSAVRLTSFT